MDAKKMAERGGFEPPVGLPLRQFSKLLLSATQPPLRLKNKMYRYAFILRSEAYCNTNFRFFT